ncbi:hypothetical protein NE237_017516 [Protea cynaroides]|uniref:Uncharacterized protein n=1 Tax=Protea cynaroides TaxID=273540 RepID=A0A9Q0QN25_9MAGN|nr:hypothetical protein NE237_017516 [Protea cynaroides]
MVSEHSMATANNSSNASTASTGGAPQQSPNFSHVHLFISIKLRHDLFGHLDGFSPRSLAPITTSLTLTTSQLQDYSLMSFLISPLSDEALPLIVGLTSSKQIWEALETAYTSTSHTRILSLHISLPDLKHKAYESISSFLWRAKAIADELTTAGRPINPANFNISCTS